VLAPGAQPLAEVVFDGAAERGWRGCEAGLLDIASVAEIFESLLAALPAGVTTQDAAVA
jgi:hypothetical protein